MTVSFGSFYDLCYVLFVKTAVFAEIFKAVPVVRKMAGCYHYSAVTFETLKDSGHEHGRGGRKPAVVYKDAGCRQALADGSLELSAVMRLAWPTAMVSRLTGFPVFSESHLPKASVSLLVSSSPRVTGDPSVANATPLMSLPFCRDL